ncbi:hypothetical protein Bca4012_085942 [Brassica carinata]|uniref:Diphthine--ammonia ligase n=1 Tax=Brassica carinata TaxID=52824 RepID=A0A8X7QLW7_BRACI|nr:hypothetical protein Bca52824_067409 [Brassica carinata]
MKVVALVSGGKDSCYVMMKCIQYGHEVKSFPENVLTQIVALANLLPVDELDSYMYQTEMVNPKFQPCFSFKFLYLFNSLLVYLQIANGIKAILVKVAAIGLDPSKHLGKDLSLHGTTSFEVERLNEMCHGVRVDHLKEPIFNLVPVLAAGNSSASLDYIITCELLSLRS